MGIVWNGIQEIYFNVLIHFWVLAAISRLMCEPTTCVKLSEKVYVETNPHTSSVLLLHGWTQRMVKYFR